MDSLFMNRFLSRMADRQSFAASDDELSSIISKYDCSEELCDDDLELIVAAESISYQDFLKKIKK